VYCTLTPEGLKRGQQGEARCREELSGLLNVAAFDDRWASMVARLRYTAADVTP
jgi:hypothetical protein